MSKRLEQFLAYAHHSWLSRVYSKLTAAERKLAIEFIAANDGLSKADFEFAINRMFLHQTNKPKNWTAISELLTCANSTL